MPTVSNEKVNKSLNVPAAKKLEKVQIEYEHTVSFKLEVKLEEAVIHLLHPDNTDYPIGKWRLSNFYLGFLKYDDQSEINIKIKDLQLFDTTEFPNTLDPSKTYSASQEPKLF